MSHLYGPMDFRIDIIKGTSPSFSHSAEMLASHSTTYDFKASASFTSSVFKKPWHIMRRPIPINLVPRIWIHFTVLVPMPSRWSVVSTALRTQCT